MSTDTALVVIDVQVGMFSASDPVYQGDELLTRRGRLLLKARQAQMPIVYIQHTSQRQDHPLEYATAGWQIHPAIAPLAEETIMQ